MKYIIAIFALCLFSCKDEVTITQPDNTLYESLKEKHNATVAALNYQLDSLKQVKDSVRTKLIPYYIRIGDPTVDYDVLNDHIALDDTFVRLTGQQMVSFRLIQGLQTRQELKICEIQTKTLQLIVSENKNMLNNDSLYIDALSTSLLRCDKAHNELLVKNAKTEQDLKSTKKKLRIQRWVTVGFMVIAFIK